MACVLLLIQGLMGVKYIMVIQPLLAMCFGSVQDDEALVSFNLFLRKL